MGYLVCAVCGYKVAIGDESHNCCGKEMQEEEIWIEEKRM